MFTAIQSFNCSLLSLSQPFWLCLKTISHSSKTDSTWEGGKNSPKLCRLILKTSGCHETYNMSLLFPPPQLCSSSSSMKTSIRFKSLLFDTLLFWDWVQTLRCAVIFSNERCCKSPKAIGGLIKLSISAACTSGNQIPINFCIKFMLQSSTLIVL